MLLSLYDMEDYDNNQKNEWVKLYIAPNINSKEIKIGLDSESKQYFLYSDDNYVIDIKMTQTSSITVKLNNQAGHTYDTEIIENNVNGQEKSKVFLSRNGRYLLFVQFISNRIIETRLYSIEKGQDLNKYVVEKKFIFTRFCEITQFLSFSRV